jgi:predicted acyl esterase
VATAVVALLACALAFVPTAAAAKLGTVRGSAEQVYLTGATPGAKLTLATRRGRAVQTKRVDRLGALIFRNVTPGRGYRVRRGRTRSRAVTVFTNRSAPLSTRGYSQKLRSSGYGYLTTRDGTKLAIDVHTPGTGKGPFPTLVEYAGYGYADPFHGPDSGIAQVANLLGFAVVDVNMRGTGCSGGAFDYFERLQSLDGYDVVETVARQPWVLHHRVGTLGISYGGISQLFVAATDPPHLAAIAPLSVIDDSASTLYPGGILNTGFTLPWAQDRDHDALPASKTGGQAWVLQEIAKGDKVCKANQALHAEAVNLVKKVYANPFYVPKAADPVSPIKFVNKIRVPVFLACQFTDEQTGGHCPDLVPHFTGTARKWFTFTNGVHTDSLDPATFNRWYDFLKLYVAQQNPTLPASAKAAAPTLYKAVLGTGDVTLPNDPIQSEPSYAAALAAYQQLPRVRVLFDNGAGSATPGNPLPGFEHSFSTFPIPGTKARSWYFGDGGALTDAKPTTGATRDHFTWNKKARPPTDFTGDTGGGPNGLWNAIPPYNWTQNPAGTAASYVSAPLAANTTIVGGGAVQVWIKSATSDVDLQATVTEVRPDGKETFVQSGWLRASRRKLKPGSSILAPSPTFRRADVQPLPKRKFALVTIPLYYEGHVYRKGSRVRVILSAPTGDNPIWAFRNTVPSSGTDKIFIAHSPSMPSRLVLPLVTGVSVPTGLPPCPGLRGEPCRTYVPTATAN